MSLQTIPPPLHQPLSARTLHSHALSQRNVPEAVARRVIAAEYNRPTRRKGLPLIVEGLKELKRPVQVGVSVAASVTAATVLIEYVLSFFFTS